MNTMSDKVRLDRPPNGAAVQHHGGHECTDLRLTVPSRWCSGAGQDAFKGTITHSDDYRCGQDYAGKRVAIIGAGESGSDICNEISKHAAATCIVIRGKHGHLIPRKQSNGRVTDLNTNRSARPAG
jgi:hypothetical protein